MDSKVHPVVALLVIILVIFAIGVWTWGSGQAKEIGGPAGLLTDPSGHLYVRMQNLLLEHDSDGHFVARHDLSEVGVERVLGAIGFFSNGDILLRRGPDPRSLRDNIRAFMRRSNEKSLRPDSPDSGLYRCNLRTIACELFGSEGIDLKATYGLFIDPHTDEVYISDTTRHVLRKYSASGEALHEPVGGFKFPNQLLVHDGRLLVADTNHHRVHIVEPATDTFGAEITSADVIPAEAKRAKQIWPSHFARVGDEWWVNNMRTGMNEGGIYVFDDNWRYKHTVALPAGADPIALLAFHGVVLISDWNNVRIHRVAASGEILGDFVSPGLQQAISESGKARLQFQAYAYLGVGVFIAVIALLLLKGLTTAPSRKRSSAHSARPSASRETPDEVIWFEPNARTVRKIEISMRVAGICLIGIIAIVIFFVIAFANRPVAYEIIPAVAALAFIYFLIAWVSRVNTGTAIGLRGIHVTLRDHTGRKATCLIKDLVYDRTVVASQDMAVFLGQPHMPLYDRELIDTQLLPKLADATALSVWKMQAKLIRMRHPQGLIILLAFIGMAAGAVWIMLWHTI